jgi:predicted MPP superfamily phosphohydrolase
MVEAWGSSAKPFDVERTDRDLPPTMIETVLSRLEQRLGGRLYAKQRLGIETDHEAQIFGQGLTFFHIENWYSIHSVIRTLFKLTGLYWRGQANAARVQVRRNDIRCKKLPPAFDGFTLLHMTDFHADMNDGAMRRLEALLPGLSYDLCVLTGDYRGATFGKFDDALARIRRVLARTKGPVYGVLGNHDTIRMVPDLETMGIRMLLNECAPIVRGSATIYLAGIDDAHFYRVDNIEKAASGIPHEAFSMLLSHTPEIYRQAAHAGFDLLLSGHTHGGQICLPGSIPLTLGSVLPRRFGAGAWQYHNMAGYTSTGVGSSIVPVRINCLPEITLHCLRRAEEDGASVGAVAQSQPEKQPRK